MYIAKFSVTLLTLFLSFAAAATQDGLLERLKADHEALPGYASDLARIACCWHGRIFDLQTSFRAHPSNRVL